GRFQLVAASKDALERRAADQVLQRAFIDGVALARLAEVHFRHQIRLAIDLYLLSLAKVARPVRCHGFGPYCDWLSVIFWRYANCSFVGRICPGGSRSDRCFAAVPGVWLAPSVGTSETLVLRPILAGRTSA